MISKMSLLYILLSGLRVCVRSNRSAGRENNQGGLLGEEGIVWVCIVGWF